MIQQLYLFLGTLSTSDLPGIGANFTVGWEQETRREKHQYQTILMRDMRESPRMTGLTFFSCLKYREF